MCGRSNFIKIHSVLGKLIIRYSLLLGQKYFFLNKKNQFVPRSKQSLPLLYETNLFILCMEKFAVSLEIRIKHRSRACVQNLKFLVVKPGGTGSALRFKRSKMHMADSKPTFSSGFCDLCLSFLSSLATLRKASISYGMSVCLCRSVRVEHLGSHWTDFHEIWYLSIFRKPVKKCQFY